MNNSSFCILSLEYKDVKQSYKVLSDHSGILRIALKNSQTKDYSSKSKMLKATSNFIFSPNDNLKIDVYKNNFSTPSVIIAVNDSEEFNLTFSENFNDTIDEKEYKTVKIGNQVWFAENYAYIDETILNNGAWIYDYLGSDIAEAKENENFKTYGVLYDWETAKNVCPDGWHLPTKEEFQQLFDYINSMENTRDFHC